MSPKSGGIPRPIGKREARRIVREHLALMIHGLDLPDLVWPEEVLDVFCDETERAATLIAPWLYASPPRPTVEGMGG